MALTRDNLDTISKLLTALNQRNNIILELADRLAQDVVWRSPDGALRLELSAAERQQLEDFIRTYVQESEMVALALKAYLGDATPGPL